MSLVLPDPHLSPDMKTWADQMVRALQEQLGTVSTGSSAGTETTTSFQTGEIKLYAGTDYDSKLWLLCDHSRFLVDEYPDLAGVLGRTWSLDDDPSDTFRVPNYVGVALYGGTADDLGLPVGEEELTIGIEHLPALALSVSDPGHTHGVTVAPHSHGVTQNPHEHNYTEASENIYPIADGTDAVAGPASVGQTAGANADITIDVEVVGVTINSAATGITVALDGGEEAIDIRPKRAYVQVLIRI